MYIVWGMPWSFGGMGFVLGWWGGVGPWLDGLVRLSLVGYLILEALLFFTWQCGTSKGLCLSLKWINFPWF